MRWRQLFIMTHVRPAATDDARAIAYVQVESWRSAYRGIVSDKFLNAISEDDRTERWTEILPRPEQATFVVEIEGYGIVGFANGGPEREGREGYRGELYAIYVLPEWTRQGIGKRLVSSFAQWLLAAGYDSMLVWVLADNPFRRFYDRLGGKAIDSAETHLGDRRLIKIAYGWQNLRDLIADVVC